MKFLSIISIALILLLFVGSVSAADDNETQVLAVDGGNDVISIDNTNEIKMNDTIVLSSNDGNADVVGVSNEGNDVVGTTYYYDGSTNLQTMINNCANGDKIVLNKEIYISSTITIGKSITIDGNGYRLYADYSFDYSLLMVNANNVVINNVRIQNGDWEGITWIGDDGKITNSYFYKSNSYYSYGSAIHWYGARGSVSGCTFENCIIDENNYGGAITWEGASGTVSGCTFKNNGAVAGQSDGGIVGAIYWTGASGTISGSTFENNFADDESAIYFRSSNGRISGCNFKNNGGGYSDSVVYVYGSNVVIENLIFSNNKDDYDLWISGSATLSGNTAPRYIYSSATIKSKTTITVFNNATTTITRGDTISLSAIIKDDNNNIVVREGLKFTLSNGTTIAATYNSNGVASANYAFMQGGTFTVSVVTSSFSNYVIYTGTVIVKPTATLVSASNVAVGVGSSVKISSSTSPSGLAISYKSANTAIATVDSSGNVKGVKVGTTSITLTVGDGVNYAKSSTTITVTVSKGSTSISVSPSSVTLTVGNTRALSASLSPSGAGSLTYSSSNTNVATVSSSGVITAVGGGTATITVSFAGNSNYNAASSKTVSVTVNKISTSIGVTSTSVGLAVGNTANAGASLSPSGATGSLTYSSSNNNVATVSSSGVITAVGAGSATININYAGNSQYAASSKSITVTVTKGSTSIGVSSTYLTLTVGNTGNAGASLSPSGAGSLTYSSNNTAVATVNSNGVITAVSGGTATITVSFGGNSNYNAAESKTITVIVNKIATSISVSSAAVTLAIGDTGSAGATLSPNSAGSLTYTSNKPGVATVNSNGVITAVSKGSAVITVSFAGNNQYAASSRTIAVTVNLKSTSISANDVTLNVDAFASINPTVNPSNLPISYSVINSSVATVNSIGVVQGISGGVTPVTLTVGDGVTYEKSSTTIIVTVNKIPTSITVNKATVSLNPGESEYADASLSPSGIGSLKYVSSNPNVVTVNENTGLITAVSHGNANILVSYGGNNKYAAASNKLISVSVGLLDATVTANDISLEIGEKKSIDPVTSPKNLNVTYNVADSSIATVDANGVVTGVNSGETTITIAIDGNGVYYNNFTTIAVSVGKVPTEITVESQLISLKAGESANIGAVLSPSGAGNLIFVSNNVNAAVVDSNGVVTGVHQGGALITISFNGNGKYKAASNKTVLVTVSLADASVTANDMVLFVDDYATINAVTTPKGLNLTYSVADSSIVGVDSSGNIRAFNRGNTTVTINLVNDDIHYANSTTIHVEVKKAQPEPVIPENVTVGDDIVVELPENATGNVTVIVDGNKTYEVPIVDGNATIPGGNLTPGNHTIEVIYPGDDNYEPVNATVNVTVDKAAPEIIIPSNVTIGDDLVIDLPDDATGNVTAIIDGNTTVTVPVINGTAVIPLDDLPVGNYTVEVIYSGDEKYDPFNATVNVAVVKDVPEVDIPTNATIGDDLVIDLPDDATGNVTVIIDGNETIVVPIVDGNVTIPTDNLTEGNHTIEIIYPGDDKYDPINATVNVTVDKPVPEVDIPTNITFGDDLVIDLPDDATGNVTVIIDGDTTITVPVVNGTAVIPLDDLPAGNHTVEVIYSGDDKYGPVNSTVNVTVDKATPDVEIPTNVTYGDDLVIDLPDDATGNVTVIVDGNETFVVPVENGTAVIPLDDLPAGNHTVEVIYSGDDNYDPIDETVNVTVDKDTPEVVVPGQIAPGDDLVIDLPDDATGNITAIVDGNTTITVPVVNGTAVIPLDDLPIGNHTVEIIYSGDDNYDSIDETVNVTVAKFVPDVVIPENITIGDDLVIELPVDATGNVTVVIDGNETITVPVVNGTAVIPFDDMPLGNHTLDIAYSGDGRYEPMNATVNVTVVKPVPQVDIPDDVPYGGDIVITLPDDATGNVTVIVDGNQTFVVPIVNGTVIIPNDNLTPGNHSIEIIYPGDDTYGSIDKTLNVTVDRQIPEVDIPENATYGEDLVIDLPDDATGNVTAIIDGNTTITVPVENGAAVIPLEDLPAGNHTIDITYSGDDNYAPVNSTVNVTVDKATPSVDIPTNATFGDDLVIDLPDDATGEVTVVIDGDKTVVVPVENGTAVIPLEDLPVGNHTLDVSYSGDDNYNPFNATVNVTIDKATPEFIVPENVSHGGDIVIELPANATGNVTVIVDGNQTFVLPVVNGTVTVPGDNLTPGNHTIEIIYPGDGNFDPVNETVNVTVLNTPDIGISSEDNNLIITLPEDATGNLTVTIDGVEYTPELVNGTAIIPNVNGGNHTITVDYSGDDKYDPISMNATEYVNGIIIIAGDVIKYYHGDERLRVTVLDKDGKPMSNTPVLITINGVEYTRVTDADGNASLALNVLPGNYSVKLALADYNLTKNVTVTIMSTIISSDVVKTFRNDTQYWALFLDKEGNPLSKMDVKFNINGVFYTRTTNESGWARMNINLVANEYILTAYNPITDEQKANTITVLSQVVSSDLTKYFRNESQFVVRITNKDGSYVGAGKEVTFNINGVFYKRTTNETGHAKLTINLNPGKYVITTMYDECVSGNTVNVLPTIVTNDLVMHYRDGSKFTAKLVDGQGKARSGETIKFNINGVLYNRVTDAEGIASLNINLVQGKYIITSMFEDSVVSNTITING